MGPPEILLCGDSALSVEFGTAIDPRINRKVHGLFKKLKENHPPGLIDLIPTYRSLLIQYDPASLSFEDLQKIVLARCGPSEIETELPGRTVEIPVCYEEEFGPDLEEVAVFHHVTAEEIVEIHTGGMYQVYMIGFTPGFPYMGGLDPRLFTPRKEIPRAVVPAGTVGIAGQQTGIYPLDSPGGWQLIGRTPIKIFDLPRPEPFYLKPGDLVKFKSISRAEFEDY